MNRPSRIFRTSLWLLLALAASAVQVRAGSDSADLIRAYGSGAKSVGGGKDKVPVLPPAREMGSRWSISAGAIFRDVGDVSFSSGSSIRSGDIPRFFRESFGGPGGAGSASGLGLRTYDNGFVQPDAGTAAGVFAGTTSSFGYISDSQNNGNQSLSFTSGGGGSATRVGGSSSSLGSALWSDDSDFQAGPYVEVDYQAPLNESISVGGQFSFSWVGFDAANTTSTFRGVQTARYFNVGVTDVYAVPAGVILPLAPYNQPDPNPPPGPLPRIFATPSRVNNFAPTGGDQVVIFNRILDSLDVDLYTFSLGPEVQFKGPWNTFFSLAGGVTLNIVPWEASHTETVYAQRNGGSAQVLRQYRAQADDNEILWGAYVQMAAGWRFGSDLHWLLQLFARYDWCQELQGKVGPSSFSVDLDSFSAGLMLGLEF